MITWMSDWIKTDLQDNLDTRETDGDGSDVREIIAQVTEPFYDLDPDLTKGQKAILRAFLTKHRMSLTDAIIAIIEKILAETALSSEEKTAIYAFVPDSIIEVRNHIVVTRHKQIKEGIYRSEVKAVACAISFQTGGIWQTKHASKGSVFICIADGDAPLSSPLDYIVRTQVWETYGKWEKAPEGLTEPST